MSYNDAIKPNQPKKKLVDRFKETTERIIKKIIVPIDRGFIRTALSLERTVDKHWKKTLFIGGISLLSYGGLQRLHNHDNASKIGNITNSIMQDSDKHHALMETFAENLELTRLQYKSDEFVFSTEKQKDSLAITYLMNQLGENSIEIQRLIGEKLTIGKTSPSVTNGINTLIAAHNEKAIFAVDKLGDILGDYVTSDIKMNNDGTFSVVLGDKNSFLVPLHQVVEIFSNDKNVANTEGIELSPYSFTEETAKAPVLTKKANPVDTIIAAVASDTIAKKNLQYLKDLSIAKPRYAINDATKRPIPTEDEKKDIKDYTKTSLLSTILDCEAELSYYNRTYNEQAMTIAQEQTPEEIKQHINTLKAELAKQDPSTLKAPKEALNEQLSVYTYALESQNRKEQDTVENKIQRKIDSLSFTLLANEILFNLEYVLDLEPTQTLDKTLDNLNKAYDKAESDKEKTAYTDLIRKTIALKAAFEAPNNEALNKFTQQATEMNLLVAKYPNTTLELGDDTPIEEKIRLGKAILGKKCTDAQALKKFGDGRHAQIVIALGQPK